MPSCRPGPDRGGRPSAAGHFRDPQGRVFLSVRRRSSATSTAAGRPSDWRSPSRSPGSSTLWAGAELFSKKGLTTESEEATKVRIVPLYAGLRCQFGREERPAVHRRRGRLLPHSRRRTRSGRPATSGIGFLGQAGLLVGLGRSFGLDVHAGYRACTVTDGRRRSRSKPSSAASPPASAWPSGFKTGDVPLESPVLQLAACGPLN
ncbi:MAG: hypothetical protein M0C28_03285 [Candidatus Moduliflexus flocculans]|nr:hypothetical protein [Candidatus Moduliflexus flocculans]